MWDPIDGEVDPSGVTYAFAKAAKVHGGKYYTHTVVKDTKQKPDGSTSPSIGSHKANKYL